MTIQYDYTCWDCRKEVIMKWLKFCEDCEEDICLICKPTHECQGVPIILEADGTPVPRSK